MIPKAAIVQWGTTRSWPNPSAIEQDLLLARMIVEIYNHPRLASELAFRGGTCLHQVVLDTPRRYSEDLDFVRRTNTGIGPVLDALRDVAAEVGLHVRGTDIGQHPKMRLVTASEENPELTLRIKVEINTHETSPAEPLVTRPFAVASSWFSGQTEVRTFTDAELISTKIRALYQRKKGRDLFDMWLGLTDLGLSGAQVLAAFGPYRPEGLTAELAINNLRAKLADEAFRNDLTPLLSTMAADYDIDQAGALVIAEVLSKL